MPEVELKDTKGPAVRWGRLQRVAARQARTVGRAVSMPIFAAPWLPRLPGADGECLGLLRHDGHVHGIALSADDRTLYSAEYDGQVHAWDLETGARLWTGATKHAGQVVTLSVSPNGMRVASASSDGTVKVWDSLAGQELLVLRGHTDGVEDVSYSPDGTRLASASRDHTVRVWDSQSGQELSASDYHYGQWITVLSYSPDGTMLASSGTGQHVRLWDTRSGEVSWLCHSENTLNALRYSPDGARLASATWETVRVWDSRSGKVLLVLRGHEKYVGDVNWSSDGAYLASISGDVTLRIWDAVSGECLRVLQTQSQGRLFERGRRVAWARSGAFLASSHDDGFVRLWDVREYATIEQGTVLSQRAPRRAPPAGMTRLAGLAAVLQRHRGGSVSLGLLRDLRRSMVARVENGPLAGQQKLAALRELGWSGDSLAAVVLLLCGDAQDPEVAVPEGTTPWELESALTAALMSGETCAEEASATAPWAAIQGVLDRLDVGRLVGVLRALGPATCAAHPEVLLALGDLLAKVVPLAAPARRVLASAVPLERREGSAHSALGVVPAGTRPSGPPWLLRAWQWGLPEEAFGWWFAQNLLLYGDRQGAEPPRLRPTVIVVDDSVESLPVEQVVRAGALMLAMALVRARVPAYVLTSAGGRVTALQHAAQMVEVLAPVDRRVVDPVGVLARAQELARGLGVSGEPPAIVLFTHVYFAADVPQVSLPGGLRAMVVRYPRHRCRPAVLWRCRHVVLGTADVHRVPDALAELLR